MIKTLMKAKTEQGSMQERARNMFEKRSRDQRTQNKEVRQTRSGKKKPDQEA